MGVCGCKQINEIDILNESSLKSVQCESFAGKSLPSKIVDVYDGDTCTINVFQDQRVKQFKFRLFGIDSPEMKPLKIQEDREIEKQCAMAAKEALKYIAGNKIVLIDFVKEEKYGRLMGTIFLTKNKYSDEKVLNVNEWMIKEKFAVRYTGKSKQKFNAKNFKKEFQKN